MADRNQNLMIFIVNQLATKGVYTNTSAMCYPANVLLTSTEYNTDLSDPGREDSSTEVTDSVVHNSLSLQPIECTGELMVVGENTTVLAVSASLRSQELLQHPRSITGVKRRSTDRDAIMPSPRLHLCWQAQLASTVKYSN